MESQIIQGDCLEVLKTIPDETLDYCFNCLPNKVPGYVIIK